jgi:hypothetical protein
MSAAEALKSARAAGIDLGMDGDNLVLEASAPPPASILDLLSRHKAGIVALLRSVAAAPETDENWQARFDERAGILEFDEGLSRPEAEALAIAQIGPRPTPFAPTSPPSSPPTQPTASAAGCGPATTPNASSRSGATRPQR